MMRKTTRKRARRLGVERLEDRKLLAGFPELLKDINVGPNGSSTSNFNAVGASTFFVANDGVTGREFWKTDGGSSAATLFMDINPIGSSNPGPLTNLNGALFFSADDGTSGFELWKTDGTVAGTERFMDINPGTGASSPTSLINVNGTLFFTANDPTNGRELWRSDGTVAGTTLVKNIRPGFSGSDPKHLTNVNGTLFFSANDGVNGPELWRSNGTPEGTIQVKDIRPGNFIGSDLARLTNVNGTLFFSANDGSEGRELWRSDGTLDGTTRVKDIRNGAQGSMPFSQQPLTNVNGTLYFSANLGGGYELWKSDGTEAGTARVSTIVPNGLQNVNGTLLFVGSDVANGDELWRSDGTFEGTSLVKDINVGSSGSSIGSVTNVNGTLYFSAFEASTGRELWKSDGTAAGTVLVRDIRTDGSGNSYPNGLTNVNGKLFFIATDGMHGTEPWVIRPESLQISATSANKSEGNSGSTSFSFTVMRSGGIAGRTTVNYAVTGSGANPATGNDFIGGAFPSGTVTFLAGQTSKVINVRVRGESAAEPNEGFRVRLSGASGDAEIIAPVATGLIRNDDTSIAIAATSADQSEGASGGTFFTFTVTRSGNTTGTTTVNYAVTGIGANPAAANDFIGGALPSGVVTFEAGQTSKVISIRVRGDSNVEADERFRVTLFDASVGTSITTAIANGVIRNDD